MFFAMHNLIVNSYLKTAMMNIKHTVFQLNIVLYVTLISFYDNLIDSSGVNKFRVFFYVHQLCNDRPESPFY